MTATRARLPVAPTAALAVPTPPGACDTHLHMFGSEYPLAPARANVPIEMPAPGTLDDWIERLESHFAALGLSRGVIVHSVAYGEDVEVTAEAMRRMGPRMRGIALVRPAITTGELAALDGAGFRGVRLNLSFGGALDLDGLERLAPRLADIGWHVTVNLPRYVGLPLGAIADRLEALPVPVVLDHYGYPDLPAGPGAPAFQRLLERLAGGRFWVKLSAGYRQCDAPFDALDPFVEALAEAAPHRLLWASDWPHVRWRGAMPDNAEQLNTLARQLPDEGLRRAVLVSNAASLYSFPTAP